MPKAHLWTKTQHESFQMIGFANCNHHHLTIYDTKGEESNAYYFTDSCEDTKIKCDQIFTIFGMTADLAELKKGLWPYFAALYFKKNILF